MASSATSSPALPPGASGPEALAPPAAPPPPPPLSASGLAAILNAAPHTLVYPSSLSASTAAPTPSPLALSSVPLDSFNTLASTRSSGPGYEAAFPMASPIAQAARQRNLKEVERLALQAPLLERVAALVAAIQDYQRSKSDESLPIIDWLLQHGQIPATESQDPKNPGSLAVVVAWFAQDYYVVSRFVFMRPEQTLEAIASSPIRPFDGVLKRVFSEDSPETLQLLLASPIVRGALCSPSGGHTAVKSRTAVMECFIGAVQERNALKVYRLVSTYSDICKAVVREAATANPSPIAVELLLLLREQPSEQVNEVLRAILASPELWGHVVGELCGLARQCPALSEGGFRDLLLPLLRGRIEQSDISWGEWLRRKICYKWALFWAYRDAAHLFVQDPYLPWIACIWNLFSRSPQGPSTP